MRGGVEQSAKQEDAVKEFKQKLQEAIRTFIEPILPDIGRYTNAYNYQTIQEGMLEGTSSADRFYFGQAICKIEITKGAILDHLGVLITAGDKDSTCYSYNKNKASTRTILTFDDKSFVDAINKAVINQDNIAGLAEHLNTIRLISMILDQLNLSDATTIDQVTKTNLLSLESVKNNQKAQDFLNELLVQNKHDLIKRLCTQIKNMTDKMFDNGTQYQLNQLLTKFNHSVYLRYQYLDGLITNYNAQKDKPGFLGVYEKVTWPGAWWCVAYIGVGGMIAAGAIALLAGALGPIVSLLVASAVVVGGLIGLAIFGLGAYMAIGNLHTDYYKQVQRELNEINSQLESFDQNISPQS